MFEVFSKKNVTIVFFLVVLSVLLAKLLKAEGLSEEPTEDFLSEETADQEDNLLEPTIEITPSPQVQILDEMDMTSTQESELSSPILDMENRECCECHTIVPQTHMERSIIITEYECQNCHLNLFQVHSEVFEPLIAGP
ncbi:MAG: hypothetical protein HN590_07160 [Calditrichaeota bacterium]|jgi:hypothetical protein|nr:hypothetical protein [Anaerolineae bacterium]MBT7617044.1 hypothetical protein [Calditrichota bacterium]